LLLGKPNSYSATATEAVEDDAVNTDTQRGIDVFYNMLGVGAVGFRRFA
jgi:hypothetical protein